MPPRPASIKVRALQWLAQREHSPQELRGKLLRLVARRQANAGTAQDAPDDQSGQGNLAASIDCPADSDADADADATLEVEALLQWLAARGYLSSERFVESRVNARQARFGNLRIRHELQQHGLQLGDSARQTLQASEEQRARDVWQRKFGQAATDAPQRLQQLRFLAGRGFSMDVVRRVVLGAGRDAARPGSPQDLDDPAI